MRIVRTSLSLSNPRDAAPAPIDVTALVDAGPLQLRVPQRIAIQLHLQELYQREVTTADGREHLCPYVGGVQITSQSCGCFVGALVSGDGVLLGSVPIDDMARVISPARRTVEVNPDSPNIRSAIVKRACVA